MKVQGETNHGMTKKLSTIDGDRKAIIQKDFGILVNVLVNRPSIHLVMEVSCNLDDFHAFGYLKPGHRTDFLMCQGMKDHAMVRRIVCDYKSYRH